MWIFGERNRSGFHCCKVKTQQPASQQFSNMGQVAIRLQCLQVANDTGNRSQNTHFFTSRNSPFFRRCFKKAAITRTRFLRNIGENLPLIGKNSTVDIGNPFCNTNIINGRYSLKRYHIAGQAPAGCLHLPSPDRSVWLRWSYSGAGH